VVYGTAAANALVNIEVYGRPSSIRGDDTCGQIEVHPTKRPGFAFVP